MDHPSKTILPSRVTVVAPGAPSAYHVASRIDQSEIGTSQMALPVVSLGAEKKKRGRPRKYKSDESSSGAFSSFHVASSASPAGGKACVEDDKLIVARPISSEKRYKSKIGTEKLDDWIECSTGSSFLPHVITVNTGEDVTTKIMEFARQGPRAVCIISGSGTVSNVTIRHPNSSGGILTYEGIFEILSFSGSFTPTESPDPKFGRSGMMTITLSGADGRVVGGLVSGLTIAAAPIKVVVASFLLSGPQEFKPEKQFTISSASGGPLGSPAPKAEKRSSNSIQFMQGPPNGSNSQNPNNWAVEEPERMAILKSMELLFLLGALTDDSKLSDPVGHQMSRLPLDPIYSKALVVANQFSCLEEMLIVVAMLSVESIFYAPREKLEESRTALKTFSSSEGDHLTLLNTYRASDEFLEKSKLVSSNEKAEKNLRKWCKENFINSRSLKHARDIHSQIRRNVEQMGLRVTSCGEDMLPFRRCLAASFFLNAALKQPDGTYRALSSGLTVQIHPSSVLFRAKPECIIFDELVRTNQNYIRNISVIDYLWLTELAPHCYGSQE